jgi:hypothetical protein
MLLGATMTISAPNVPVQSAAPDAPPAALPAAPLAPPLAPATP